MLSLSFGFAWLTAVSTLLLSLAGHAQPTVNQPGSTIDIRIQDLEAATIQSNWLSYHGDYTGRRYTSLEQVTRNNVSQLQLQWVFHSRHANLAGASPIVVGGVMYIAASNDTFAIDARTGTMLWHYTRQSNASSTGNKTTHASGGAAVLGSRLYVVTDDAHLLCLDARSGSLVWEIAYAGGNRDNGATSAPLVVHDKIIVGVSGSRHGVSGFIAAFDAADGKEVWRFRADAVPGDNNSSNQPVASHTRCDDAMWMPGTYDPDRHAIYWATGHSSAAHEGSAQHGEDQNVACLLALDAESGKLKWSSRLVSQGHCGDDAPRVPVLISTTYEGTPRTLIVEASRNGFPNLLDRETGVLLSTPEKPCQGIPEAESWYASSYSEQTHLFYFRSVEGPSANVLVAYDPATKTITWKGSRIGPSSSPSGLLTTSTGLLFFGDASSSFKAADAASGKLLWQLNIGQSPSSLPIGYSIGEKQYFAVAAGMDLFAFGLP